MAHFFFFFLYVGFSFLGEIAFVFRFFYFPCSTFSCFSTPRKLGFLLKSSLVFFFPLFFVCLSFLFFLLKDKKQIQRTLLLPLSFSALPPTLSLFIVREPSPAHLPTPQLYTVQKKKKKKTTCRPFLLLTLAFLFNEGARKQQDAVLRLYFC